MPRVRFVCLLLVLVTLLCASFVARAALLRRHLVQRALARVFVRPPAQEARAVAKRCAARLRTGRVERERRRTNHLTNGRHGCEHDELRARARDGQWGAEPEHDSDFHDHRSFTPGAADAAIDNHQCDPAVDFHCGTSLQRAIPHESEHHELGGRSRQCDCDGHFHLRNGSHRAQFKSFLSHYRFAVTIASGQRREVALALHKLGAMRVAGGTRQFDSAR